MKQSYKQDTGACTDSEIHLYATRHIISETSMGVVCNKRTRTGLTCPNITTNSFKALVVNYDVPKGSLYLGENVFCVIEDIFKEFHQRGAAF